MCHASVFVWATWHTGKRVHSEKCTRHHETNIQKHRQQAPSTHISGQSHKKHSSDPIIPDVILCTDALSHSPPPLDIIMTWNHEKSVLSLTSCAATVGTAPIDFSSVFHYSNNTELESTGGEQTSAKTAQPNTFEIFKIVVFNMYRDLHQNSPKQLCWFLENTLSINLGFHQG